MHIGRIIYIAYLARYSLFVLKCRKTHITHSLNITEMLPEIHTIKNLDFLKSIIHSQIIKFSV